MQYCHNPDRVRDCEITKNPLAAVLCGVTSARFLSLAYADVWASIMWCIGRSACGLACTLPDQKKSHTLTFSLIIACICHANVSVGLCNG